MLGVLQGERAERAGAALAAARGHEPERLLAKPSFGNLLVWKTVYAHGPWFQVDAVRLGLQPSYFPGERVRRLDPQRSWPGLERGSIQARDIERFRHFSDGWVAPSRGPAPALIDVRYSLVPNEIDPLWGIRLHPGRPGRHVDFFTARDAGASERAALWRMLRRPGLRLADLQAR